MSASSAIPPTCPARVPGDLVTGFDHLGDEAFLADPFGTFDALYDGPPIVWSTAHGGFWILTREALVREALQTPEIFGNNPVGIPGTPRSRPLIPLELDPPEHTWYRSLLAPWFSPKSVNARATEVQAVADSLVVEFADAGSCDAHLDYAQPLPTRIFVRLLGLEETEAKKFLDWNWTLLHDYADPAARQAAGAAVAEHLTELVAERLARPADDLISDLAAQEVQGRRLTAEELVNVCYLLFLAGLDTVVSGLTFAFSWLAQHPEQQARLVADPSLVTDAVEELLRAHSFVQATRTVRADATFHGVELAAGDRVLVATALASRDPAEQADMGEVDFDRKGARNYAFGGGAHRCLGSHLARLEMVTAIETFHRAIPRYGLAAGAEITHWGGGVLGIPHLELVWPVESKENAQ